MPIHFLRHVQGLALFHGVKISLKPPCRYHGMRIRTWADPGKQLATVPYQATALCVYSYPAQRAAVEAMGAGILRRLRNHGYSSPENDTWVYKVVADSSCRKNRYQPIRHAAAAGGRAPGHVWGQYIQLQHTPADPEEEASLAPLSRAGLGPEGRSRLLRYRGAGDETLRSPGFYVPS
ncbi:hypothetical protein Q9233_004484 [Columba guinea]|nr:hypothetical protein Q9233_004484 [Columba guinea]